MRFHTLITTLLLAGVSLAAPAQTHDTVAAKNGATGIVPHDNAATARDSVEVRHQHAEKTPDQRREHRGISSRSTRIVPRGQWIFGGTLSYSTHSNDKYTFLVVEGINSEGYTFKVSPFIGYAVKNNMAVGARVVYSRSLLKLDDAQISMDDLNLGIDYYYALKHSYEVAAVWRQYIPLGRNKRFAIFTELQLGIGGTQSKFAEGSPVRGTYETGYTVSLGLNPGIVAFATNNVAFEVNVGVMGFNYSNTKQVHNQVTVGNRSSSYMNFKVNIFSIGMGVAFYL